MSEMEPFEGIDEALEEEEGYPVRDGSYPLEHHQKHMFHLADHRTQQEEEEHRLDLQQEEPRRHLAEPRHHDSSKAYQQPAQRPMDEGNNGNTTGSRGSLPSPPATLASWASADPAARGNLDWPHDSRQPVYDDNMDRGPSTSPDASGSSRPPARPAPGRGLYRFPSYESSSTTSRPASNGSNSPSVQQQQQQRVDDDPSGQTFPTRTQSPSRSKRWSGPSLGSPQSRDATKIDRLDTSMSPLASSPSNSNWNSVRSASPLSRSPSSELSRSALSRRISLERRNSLRSQLADGSRDALSSRSTQITEVSDSELHQFSNPGGALNSAGSPLRSSLSRSRFSPSSPVEQFLSSAAGTTVPPTSDPPPDVDEPWIDLPTVSTKPGLSSSLKEGGKTASSTTASIQRFSPEHSRTQSDSQIPFFTTAPSSSPTTSFPTRPAARGRTRSYTGVTRPPSLPSFSPPTSPPTTLTQLSPSSPTSALASIRGFAASRGIEGIALSSPQSRRQDDGPPSLTSASPGEGGLLSNSVADPPVLSEQDSGPTQSRPRSPPPFAFSPPSLEGKPTSPRRHSYSPATSSSPSFSTLASTSPLSFRGGHHRRSPSMGGNFDAALSISPRGPGYVTNGPFLFPPSPSTSSTSSSQSLSPRSPPSASPTFATSTNGRDGSPRSTLSATPRSPVSDPAPNRPVGLAFDSFANFRFGGSRSPSPTRTSDKEHAIQEQESIDTVTAQQGNDTIHGADHDSMLYHGTLGMDETSAFTSHFSPESSSFHAGTSPEASGNLKASLAPLERQPSIFDGEADSGSSLYEDANDAPPSPLMASIPLPLEPYGDPSEEPSHLSDWGISMSMEGQDEEPFHHSIHDTLEHDIDEESLTPLERIFLFAKSEMAEVRESVCRSLPHWLEQVEICEAVEYVLPLFNGLALDEDNVKEAFVSILDRLMYWFFSQCPLLELSAFHGPSKSYNGASHLASVDVGGDQAGEHSSSTRIAVSSGGLEILSPNSPGETEVQGNQTSEVHDVRRCARAILTDDIGHEAITPGTGSTLVSSDETLADTDDHRLFKGYHEESDTVHRPALAVNTFHELLGRLLLDDSSIVSAMAQDALVRFFMRLAGNPPPDDGSNEGDHHPADALKIPYHAPAHQHEHEPYNLGANATDLIRHELITGIVVALTKLDCEDPPELVSLLKHPAESRHPTPAVETEDAASKLSSFFDSPVHDTLALENGRLHEIDAQQGRLVGMHLITAFADTDDCLSPELYEDHLLPAVLGCVEESQGIRKQCVDALAALADHVSQARLKDDLLPLVERFSEDSNMLVRRGICSSLVDYVEPIEDSELQEAIAIRLAQKFARDSSGPTQQALWEVLGPLIYIFKDRVPDELLDLFLGKDRGESDTTAPPSSVKEDPNAFAPLVPAFAVVPYPPLDTSSASDSKDADDNSWDPATDHERAIISAYNLPGVCLSLGPSGWPRVQSLHHKLATRSTASQPKYLIASSLHDVAKIIGPEQSSKDLLPIFDVLSQEKDFEITTRLWERSPDFIQHLPDRDLDRVAQALLDTWDATPRRDWRLREILAESLASLAPRLATVGRLKEPFFQLLEKTLHDEIAAVRLQGLQSITPLFDTTSDFSGLWSSLEPILVVLQEHGNHKLRALVPAILSRVIKGAGARVDGADFTQIAEKQSRVVAVLARDVVVDVRIPVARLLVQIVEVSNATVTKCSSHQAIFDIVELLANDPEAVVREILEPIRPTKAATTVTPHENHSDAHSDSSSDNEDDDSIQYRKRLSHQTIDGSMPMALQPSSKSDGDAQSQGGDVGANASQGSADKSCGEADEHEYHANIELNDDDETESIDLDSSTIMEADLDSLSLASGSLVVCDHPSSSEAQEAPPSPFSSEEDTADYRTIPTTYTHHEVESASKPRAFVTTLPQRISVTDDTDDDGRAGFDPTRPSWAFSMREEEQFVSIDIIGSARRLRLHSDKVSPSTPCAR